MSLSGHDGIVPLFVETQGTGRINPKNGQVLRGAELSPQNSNIDRLQWLKDHNLIQQHHLDAGRRLQSDAELSEWLAFSSCETQSRSSGGANSPADVKIDASRRFVAAMKILGHKTSADLPARIVEWVVVHNVSLGKAAQHVGKTNEGFLTALIVALDVLAVHYQLA